jgi:ribonuclease E
LNNLKTAWDAIVAANDGRPAPFLIFQESDAVTRGLRDYFSDDVGECLIDQPEAFQKALEYMQRFMPPDAQRKLKLYTDPVPLFTRYQIESQIESAYSHKVTLPSGGSLVIDHTEALVSIDINSARSTRGGDIEATARNTNLEAAEEIARQLRLRDIGGLIVIDFIDMESTANQRAVEDMLRDAVKMDRARIQLGRLSRFGLLELSRQRLRPALSETTHINCPRCSGLGTIRGVESMSLSLLRLIGEEARKERTGRVIAQVPVDVATYLMNEKRDWLNQIESRDKVSLVIVPNPHLQTPAYTLRRIRDDEKELPENTTVSYQLADQPVVDDSNIGSRDKKPQGEAPLVPSILPASAAPIIPIPMPEAPPAPPAPIEVAREGALVRLWRWLFGAPSAAANARTESQSAPAPRDRAAPRDPRPDRNRSGSGDRNRDHYRDRDRNSRRDGPGARDGSGRVSGRDGPRDAGRDPRRDRPDRDASARQGNVPGRDSPGRDGPGRDSLGRVPGRDDAPRSDAPRTDQPPRSDSAGRGDAPRTGDRDSGGEQRPSSERTGRSRRRRGRGRRDGGENAANGPPNSNEAAVEGGGNSSSRPEFAPRPEAPPQSDSASRPDAAPRPEAAGQFEAPPRPEMPPRTDSAAAFERVPSVPTPPPAHDVPQPRQIEPSPAPAGNDSKYVVWSSAPSDVPRSGPDDR